MIESFAPRIELEKIIKSIELEISKFHKTRNDINRFKRAIKALFSRNVHVQCINELTIVYNELSEKAQCYNAFYKHNKKHFSGVMRDYLDSYKHYIDSVVLASKKRLEMQIALLNTRDLKNARQNLAEFDEVTKEFDSLTEICLARAKAVNEIVDRINSHDQ